LHCSATASALIGFKLHDKRAALVDLEKLTGLMIERKELRLRLR
jgi:hypothetical protein